VIAPDRGTIRRTSHRPAGGKSVAPKAGGRGRRMLVGVSRLGDPLGLSCAVTPKLVVGEPGARREQARLGVHRRTDEPRHAAPPPLPPGVALTAGAHSRRMSLLASRSSSRSRTRRRRLGDRSLRAEDRALDLPGVAVRVGRARPGSAPVRVRPPCWRPRRRHVQAHAEGSAGEFSARTGRGDGRAVRGDLAGALAPWRMTP